MGLLVHPDHWGTGAGSSLLTAALAVLPQPQVRVWVLRDITAPAGSTSGTAFIPTEPSATTGRVDPTPPTPRYASHSTDPDRDRLAVVAGEWMRSPVSTLTAVAISLMSALM
ncbi:hypothetical protein ACFQX7_28015 [Luedemannella flava]